MGISHRNAQARMTQNLLKCNQITAIHNKVTGKGMSKNIRHLPPRSLSDNKFDCLKFFGAVTQRIGVEL